MEYKKLDIATLFDGLCTFVKQQFKGIDTWVMISCFSYFGGLFLWLFVAALIGIDVLYFVFNASSIFDFKNNPLIFISSMLVTLILLFLIFKIAKKAMGVTNCLSINALAAVKDTALPKFSQLDERLSFLILGILYFLIILLGTVCLIVPAIIFIIRFYFAYLIMLEEKSSPIQALSKSWEMTQGYFWQIFVFTFPLFLISLMVPLFSILFIFIPLNFWVQAYIYQQIKQERSAQLTD